MLQGFYKHDRHAVTNQVRKYVEEDFFTAFPKWRGKVAVVIVGSTATSNYDRFSDVDLDIIASERRIRDLYSIERIKAYKKGLLARGEPIQIHKPTTIKEIESELRDWSKDRVLREYAQAMVICDPENRFRTIQKRYRWYPRKIFLEKLNWLFAEAVFEFHDRFEIAAKRGERYFIEVSKLHILRLLLNAVLMAHGRFPAFDKHVFQDVTKLRSARSLRRTIDRLLIERNVKKEAALLRKSLGSVERLLVSKRLIGKKDPGFWIGLRPKYKVQLG